MNHFREFHNASLMHSSPPVKVTRKIELTRNDLPLLFRLFAEYAVKIVTLKISSGLNCKNFVIKSLRKLSWLVVIVHIHRRKLYLNNISIRKGLNNSY